jgi:hypothetical protein
MKKLFLVCLMMLAGSAWAEWVMYGETEEALFIMTQPQFVKMEICVGFGTLQDLRKRGKVGEMSRRIGGIRLQARALQVFSASPNTPSLWLVARYL